MPDGAEQEDSSVRKWISTNSEKCRSLKPVSRFCTKDNDCRCNIVHLGGKLKSVYLGRLCLNWYQFILPN